MLHTSNCDTRSDFGTIAFEVITANESSTMPWLEGSVEALIEDVKAGPHEFTKETNKECALIMNHPELKMSELPGNLKCFNNYNGKVPNNSNTCICLNSSITHDNAHNAIITDGLRYHYDFKTTGMWLFKRDSTAPLEGVKLRSGLVAEWDHEFPLGLAVVVPSGAEISDEENKYACNVHFCGRHNLLRKFNVIFHHGNHHEKSRTDKRIKARCYFRIRILAMAEPAPSLGRKKNADEAPEDELVTVGSAEVKLASKSDVEEAASMGRQPGTVRPAMDTSSFLQTVSHKKIKTRPAIDAPKEVLVCDDEQPQPHTTKYAKTISEQLMVAVTAENEDLLTGRVTSAKTISEYLRELRSVSLITPARSEAWSPTLPPIVYQPMDFAEALAATEAKGKEAASLEIAAKTFPIGSTNRTMLLDKANEAKIEAVKVMNAAKF